MQSKEMANQLKISGLKSDMVVSSSCFLFAFCMQDLELKSWILELLREKKRAPTAMPEKPQTTYMSTLVKLQWGSPTLPSKQCHKMPRVLEVSSPPAGNAPSRHAHRVRRKHMSTWNSSPPGSNKKLLPPPLKGLSVDSGLLSLFSRNKITQPYCSISVNHLATTVPTKPPEVHTFWVSMKAEWGTWSPIPPCSNEVLSLSPSQNFVIESQPKQKV